MIFRIKRHKCKRSGGGWCDYQGRIIGIDTGIRLSSRNGLDILVHEIIEAVDANEYNCNLPHEEIDRLGAVIALNLKRRFDIKEKKR